MVETKTSRERLVTELKPVPLLDLKAQYSTIREDLRAAMDRSALGNRKAQRDKVGDSDRNTRGLLSTNSDRQTRDKSALLGDRRSFSPKDWLPNNREHELQCSRRADCLQFQSSVTVAGLSWQSARFEKPAIVFHSRH